MLRIRISLLIILLLLVLIAMMAMMDHSSTTTTHTAAVAAMPTATANEQQTNEDGDNEQQNNSREQQQQQQQESTAAGSENLKKMIETLRESVGEWQEGSNDNDKDADVVVVVSEDAEDADDIGNNSNGNDGERRTSISSSRGSIQTPMRFSFKIKDGRIKMLSDEDIGADVAETLSSLSEISSLIKNPALTSMYMMQQAPIEQIPDEAADHGQEADADVEEGETMKFVMTEEEAAAGDPVAAAPHAASQTQDTTGSVNDSGDQTVVEDDDDEKRKLVEEKIVIKTREMYSDLKLAEKQMDEYVENGVIDESRVDEIVALLEPYQNVSSVALYLLGHLYKTDRYSRFDLEKAYQCFLKSTHLGGPNYPTSQFELGLFASHFDKIQNSPPPRSLSLDHGDSSQAADTQEEEVEVSPPFRIDKHAKSLLHHFFAALAGSFQSQMTLGYRHTLGVQGAPKNCIAAANYYKLSAITSIQQFEEEGISTAADLAVGEQLRLSDEDAATMIRSRQHDMMDYYEYNAKKGDDNSKLVVGYAHMFGMRGVEQNPELAHEYFEDLAHRLAPEAFGPLGQMYLKGMHGIEQDNKTAFEHFKRGAELGDANSKNGLGYMHLNGIEPAEHDVELAFRYFNESAHQGNAEAQYNLGILYLSGPRPLKVDYEKAFRFFTLSAQQGQLLAHYQLGMMYLEGKGTRANCDSAVQLLKFVSERSEYVNKKLERAYDSYLEGDYISALVDYLTLAEMGVETAQSNAAYMYDHGLAVLEVHMDQLHRLVSEVANDDVSISTQKETGDDGTAADSARTSSLSQEDMDQMIHDAAVGLAFNKALTLYEMSALQGRTDSNIKIGDYYYYGLGTDVDYEKSVQHYKKASDNAQALFNIGYMHQHGKGLPQDVHLSKRHYDMALSLDESAYVPVMLAMLSLFMQCAWSLITQGSDDLLIFMFGEEATEWFRDTVGKDELVIFSIVVLLALLLTLRQLLLVVRSRRLSQQQNELQ